MLSIVRALLLAGALLLPLEAVAQEPPPVVHAVLFYSPTCPHCHQVITEHLVPMQNRYGDRLVILAFDVSQQFANNVYMGMLRRFEIPQSDWVVPILVAGEEVMIGGFEIPSRFPDMVEAGLASGGIDLPDIPELLSFLESQDMLETRYPGRRMTKRPPAEEAPAPSTDSSAARDTALAAQDTLPAAGDSVPGSPEPLAPQPDSLPGETPAVAVSPPDTQARIAPAPADSGAPPEATPAGAIPGEERGEARPASPGEEVPDTVENPGRSRTGGGGDSVAVGAGNPAAPSPEGPMGLGQAARELESAGMWDRFRRDPVGNSFSVAVLLLMVASLAWTAYPPRAPGRRWPAWSIPALVVVGFGVASYLSFVEVTHAEAVCGPVGDCNTVNQSEYARLFGILPVGVLGLAGYLVILALWIVARTGPEGGRRSALLGLWASALFGTFFSIYLTFLEPFVIGATCAWCLTSALVMTLLLWASAPLAREVWPTSGVRGATEGARP